MGAVLCIRVVELQKVTLLDGIKGRVNHTWITAQVRK